MDLHEFGLVLMAAVVPCLCCSFVVELDEIWRGDSFVSLTLEALSFRDP